MKKIGSVVLLLLFVAGALWLLQGCSATPAPDPAPAALLPSDPGDDQIVQFFLHGRSGDFVESAGIIKRILRDDTHGTRHQQIIVTLGSGHELMISHNIDVAPSVPWSEGERVDFRGQYEWDRDGGAIHWTHHDPEGEIEGGWLRYQGQIYK